MVKFCSFTGDEVDIHHALPVYLPSDGASSDDACWKNQHQVASPQVAPGGEEQRGEGGSGGDGGQPPVPARLPAHQQPLQGQKSPYFPPIVNQFPSRSIKPMRKFICPECPPCTVLHRFSGKFRSIRKFKKFAANKLLFLSPAESRQAKAKMH